MAFSSGHAFWQREATASGKHEDTHVREAIKTSEMTDQHPLLPVGDVRNKNFNKTCQASTHA